MARNAQFVDLSLEVNLQSIALVTVEVCPTLAAREVWVKYLGEKECQVYVGLDAQDSLCDLELVDLNVFLSLLIRSFNAFEGCVLFFF